MPKMKTHADMLEKDVDLNEEKSIQTKEEVKVVGKYLKSLSFHERMRGLSLHRCPLKD